MNDDKWKYIPERKIIIDFSNCKCVGEIHEKLKESFGFPDYYGRNWSAFWDCLDDFCGDRTSETTVHVDGLNHLSKELGSYAEKMVVIMRRAEEKYPLVHFVFS